MDERQILTDMLDKKYGYDRIIKNGDAEEIALINDERNGKYKELNTQINSICQTIAEELKKILGEEQNEILKQVRSNVFICIRAEFENGNQVLDTDGKISVGKITDIVTQSKKEILESVMAEKDSPIGDKKGIESIVKETPRIEDKKISENLERLGLNLSEGAKSELEIALRKVREFTEKVQEKVDSGMTKEDAVAWYFSQMTKKDQQEFMAYIQIAGKYELANLLYEQESAERHSSEQSQDKNAKQNTQQLSEDVVMHEGMSQSLGKINENASPSTILKQRSTDAAGFDMLEYISLANEYGKKISLQVFFNERQEEIIQVADSYNQQKVEIISGRQTNSYSQTNSPVHLIQKKPEDRGFIDQYTGKNIGSTVPTKQKSEVGEESGIRVEALGVDNRILLQSIPNAASFIGNFLPLPQNEENILFGGVFRHDIPIKKTSELVSGLYGQTLMDKLQSQEDGYSYRPIEEFQDKSDILVGSTIAHKIPDEGIEMLMRQMGEYMSVDPMEQTKVDVGRAKLEETDVKSTIGGAVEMIVDETATIQETQPVAPVTWAIADIKSRIAAEGRTRDILAANDNLQGSVKMEIPTDERNTPQGSSTVDDTEVGGEELE